LSLGPTGLSFSITKTASNLYRLQTGYLYHYTYSILVSITFLLLLREILLIFGFYLNYKLFLVFFVTLFFI
jgi:hypothetical protein